MTFAYVWKSNGTAIAKATKSTYSVAKKVAGTKITVTVTAKLAGYAPVTVTSKKTKPVTR